MKIQILFLISFTFTISLFSQNKTGIGNVSDNAGILIPNAIVQISPSSDTTMIFEYVCDKNGNYSFDITLNDNVYILNILPSVQTLQFSHDEEYITLSNGNNEILFHTVELSGNNGINFTVTDTVGNPISGAKVMLYDTQSKWEIDSCRIAKAVYTDINGQVEINSLLPIKYWFNVINGYMTNRFTLDSTTTAIDTNNTTNITVVIRDLTLNEFYMCGSCDNKTWITDSIIVFGTTLPYDADTKLLSDGTWWDSNGRFGYWWFNSSETVMTYNYIDGTANGSIIDATNLTITDSTWVGDMLFNGLSVTYFMSVPYLDTITLDISVQDTTIYLNGNGIANITSDDLFINSGYCFTCNTTLSQYSFDINEIGDNEIYVTIEDRCGNSAVDTLTITIAEAITSTINELVKSNVNIYPNPSSDFVLIESKDDRIKRIELYTIDGVIVSHFVINTKQFTYNTSEIAKGIYVFKIYTTKGVVTKKIVVK
jgi:hypothetical protein